MLPEDGEGRVFFGFGFEGVEEQWGWWGMEGISWRIGGVYA